MKKLLFILLAVSACLAQTGTPTTYLQLYKPVAHEQSWGARVAGNFDTIDNIFSLATCGDATHGVKWNATTKALGCQAITGTGVWGSITGTLSGQTDLQTALNLKAPLSSPTLVTPTLGVASATSLTTSGSNGGIDGTEGDCSGLTAASAHDLLCPNSTAHAWQVNNNNGGFKTLAVTVVSGTSALGTSAVSSATCATVVTTAATGVATTDNIQADFNADPTAVNGYSPSSAGMLTIIKYPTASNVNFKVCNNTSGSITPGAITLNWRVAR